MIPDRPATGREIAIAVIAVVLLALLVALDIGTRWGQAGTRLVKICDGQTALYVGRVAGSGVLTVDEYEAGCAAVTGSEPPTYRGDSTPRTP